MSKKTLMASFVEREKLEGLLNKLNENFGIPKDKIFIYEKINDNTIIITFKLKNNHNSHYKYLLPNTISIHKKGSTYYTINALNNIIRLNNKDKIGNINYKSVKVNWGDYENQFLITKKGKLFIYDLKRIFN